MAVLKTMSSQERPLPSQFKPSRRRPVRTIRQVVVQEVSEEGQDPERLNRLAFILSEALSRQLGQEKSAGE